ncbi:MAG: DsbA family protein [Ferruginibacter sp.]|nr:DsbA family protein [Ferruginibacter sp.]
MPLLIYIYDAYCGWCYGFSPVIKQIADQYKDKLQFEVLSAGMILPEKPIHINAVAGFIAQAYKTVEERTGVEFGKDYLWHIFNPDQSDWYPNSEKPAIALCVLKQMLPDKVVQFAADFQHALHYEGRDLTDDEAYRHILDKYGLDTEAFFQQLKSEDYRKMAHEEFNLVKQLQVAGFPAVYIQDADGKFYQLTEGYVDYQELTEKISRYFKGQ